MARNTHRLLLTLLVEGIAPVCLSVWREGVIEIEMVTLLPS